MNVKVFQTNANGKIEFSRNELEKLLNEVYNDGYNAGEKHMRETYWTWSPNTWTTTINTQSLPTTYTNETSNLTTVIDNLKATNTDKVTTNDAADCTKTIKVNPSTWESVTASANELESIINHFFGEKKETSIHRNDAYGDLAKELSSL